MFEQAKKLVENSNNIYLVAHKNPDGDAIGSTFGMKKILEKMGKKATVVMSSYSDIFKFLPDIDSAVKFIEDKEYDLLIALDSSDIDRLDIDKGDIKKANSILMIDHHKKSAPFGDINCIKDTAPAASELVYEFMLELGVLLDQDIATYIYSGIMTDTGSFNYSTTTKKTMQIASELVDTGIDFSYICKRLNHTMKEGKLKLISKAIEKMEVYFNGKLRYTYIDYDTISAFGLNDEDAEGATNYLLMPEGTEVAVYVRQKSDMTYKVSMRSAGKVSVADIAISSGGGGHTRAAGYNIPEDIELEKAKKELIKKIEAVI